MKTFNEQQISADNIEQIYQKTDLNSLENANHSLIQAHLSSHYKLCQDVIQIANQYLLRDFSAKDFDDVKTESNDLVKNLLARIFQNFLPEKCCIYNKGDKFASNDFISFEITSPSAISDSTKLSFLSDHNDLADSAGDIGIIMKASKKIQKQPDKAEKVKFKSSQDNCSADLTQNKQKSKKDFWSREEDNQLLALLKSYGKKWTKIGKMIGRRTGKQVRERYLNKLRPDIKDVDWTEEEDHKFLSLYEKFGNKWSYIANNLPGRTENQVKNRFYTRISKLIKTGIRSKQELIPQNINDFNPQESFHVDKEQSYLQEQSNSEKIFLGDRSPEYINSHDYLCRLNDPKHNSWNF